MPKPILQLLVFSALSALVLTACSGSDAGEATAPKACNYANTYDAIQATVFEAKGCTASTCHGESMFGDLDLRADASFDALIRQPSDIEPSTLRVLPGDQAMSLLYQKLSAATEGSELGKLGQPMPIGVDPLDEDQLEAVRLWIRAGAPSDSIVGGTLELLGCDGTFEPDPNKINPLPPPTPGEGVQFYAGAWPLDAEAEDELCFASYYDFRDQVPAEYQVDCDQFGEGRKCFAFRRNELAQDGQSHHSIITVYTPESDPNGGDWGPWTCLGGDEDGQSCDPAVADTCGPWSQCTTPAITSVGCIAYPFAPSDFGQGGGVGDSTGTKVQLAGAQESSAIDLPPAGVYSVLPLQGFVSWNSHGFNLTKKGTTIEQWVNLSFAPESERLWVRQQIFESGRIFAMTPVMPFEKREICMTWNLPQHSQLLSLSSHMHLRGERFRIWLPPNEPCPDTDDCLPSQSAPDYESLLYDDPLYTYYDPAIGYPSAAEVDRTFKACAVYDNGADNPFQVKRESTKPNTPACSFPVFVGCGCAASERVCLSGDRQGALCDGDDTVCGEGGLCDACPLLGGFTTDDEMFIPLGSYYIQTP